MRGGHFREVVARGDLTVLQLPVNGRMAGSFSVSMKLPTYPFPKPTLTPKFLLRAKCWLRGEVGGQFHRNVKGSKWPILDYIVDEFNL